VLHSAHANKETNKNSHLITQESFGSLVNFVSLKEGGVEGSQNGGQIEDYEKEE
jgi:hypothetical protein